MTKNVKDFWAGVFIILSTLWGVAFLFHVFPLHDEIFCWWYIPYTMTIFMISLFLVIIGLALISASTGD